MNTAFRLLGVVLISLIVAGATTWGALALWYSLPADDGIRGTLALAFAVLGAGGLLTALFRRRLIVPLLPLAVAFVALLAWW